MKTHKFDAMSFVAGLVFTALGAAFLIPNDNLELVDWVRNIGQWGWPVLLLGLGAAVLATVLVPRDRDQTGGTQNDSAS